MRELLMQYIRRKQYLETFRVKPQKVSHEIQKLNVAIAVLTKRLKNSGVLCNCCDSCLDENVTPLDSESQ